MTKKAKAVRPDKPTPKLRAFLVTENQEHTGGVIFAHHAIVARRRGADEYADGEFSDVTCRRAPWADAYAGQAVPAGLLVEHGWRFEECGSCGRVVDEDVADRWFRHDMTPEEHAAWEARFAHWRPQHIVGSQHSLVFCDEQCRQNHLRVEAERKRIADRCIAAFIKLIERRFPDATIQDDGNWKPHAYVTRDHSNRAGRMVPEQIAVSFSFPGQKYGPATLRWERRSRHQKKRPTKPYFECLAGDRETFESWAKSHTVAA